MKPLIIIGSGLAGIRTAYAFRKLNTTRPLHIITQDDGYFYSKPMLSAALSRQFTPEALVQKTADQLAEQLNAQIQVFQTVNSIDAGNTRIAIDGVWSEYHALVLAVGATPRPTEFLADAASDRCFRLNNRLEYAHFRAQLKPGEHVLVIGGGFVGCEMAYDLIQTGYAVSFILRNDDILASFLPPQMRKSIRDALESLGVRCYVDTVTGLKSDDDHCLLSTASGEQYPGDRLITSIGLLPNTTLARTAGLTVNRGICTDAFLRTSDPNIYALGDCAEINGHLRMHVSPINLAARVLASVINEENTAAMSSEALPFSIKAPGKPMAMLPAQYDQTHYWEESGTALDRCGRLLNQAGQLVGFALSGECLKERATLQQQLQQPDV